MDHPREDLPLQSDQAEARGEGPGTPFRIPRKPLPTVQATDPPFVLSKTTIPSSRAGPSWWVFELLAGLLSLVSFAGLIILLRFSNRREQQSWSYEYLTLLTTITKASLLTAVAASIGQAKWYWFSATQRSIARGKTKETPFRDLEIFDEASRWAWGSLRLLWRTGAFHLASIGAAIMVLSIAFDTFAQQVVSTQYRQVPIHNNFTAAAPVARSQFWDDSAIPANGPITSYWLDLNMAGMPTQLSIRTRSRLSLQPVQQEIASGRLYRHWESVGNVKILYSTLQLHL